MSLNCGLCGGDVHDGACVQCGTRENADRLTEPSSECMACGANFERSGLWFPYCSPECENADWAPRP